MKIAVASSGRWLESDVDYHTGRAACFVLYDTQTETFEVLDNWKCMECVHWAGVNSANRIVAMDADVVIVRHIGPNTFRAFLTANVHVFYTKEMSVVQAIRQFREGKLPPAIEFNCAGHGHL